MLRWRLQSLRLRVIFPVHILLEARKLRLLPVIMARKTPPKQLPARFSPYPDQLGSDLSRVSLFGGWRANSHNEAW